MKWPGRPATFASLLVAATAIAGCRKGPTMVPVSGKVIYNGKPVQFGCVTFQPPSGQPAQGDIKNDGTFQLSTYKLNDGAVVGRHQVRIACYESQKPGVPKSPGEQSLGKLLIPAKYTYFDQSGFTADVSADGNEPFVFTLTGPPG